MQALADRIFSPRGIPVAAARAVQLVWCAAIFVGLLLCVSCTVSRYGDARWMLAKGDYAGAAAQLAANPALDGEGWALLAEARLKAGDYAGVSTAARESLKRSAQYAPRVTHAVQEAFVAQLTAAVEAYDAGQYTEVVTQFGKLRVFAESAELFLRPEQRAALTQAAALAAALAVSLKDFPGAREQLAAVRAEWASDPALLEQLAQIYDRMGDAQQCAEVCETALKLTPDNSRLLELRAQSYCKQGQTAAAITAYQDALKQASSSARIIRELGTLLYDLEAWREARGYLQAAANGSPDSLALLELIAECYYHDGLATEAAGCYARLAAARPTESTGYRGQAACCYLLGQTAAADSLLMLARELEHAVVSPANDSIRVESNSGVSPLDGGGK